MLTLLFLMQDVSLDSARHHLGDNQVDGFATPAPEGLTWSARVPELPALPAGQAWALAITVNHVTPADEEDFENGGYRNEIRVDGERVAYLNDFVNEEDSGSHAVWVPLPGIAFESRTIEIAAGQAHDGNNHDDFELDDLRLAPVRRVGIRIMEGDALVPAKLLFQGVPRLGPNSGATADRAVFTHTGEAAVWLPLDLQCSVTASRGPEYTIATAAIPPDDVTLRIERVVATPNMVAADFHLHAAPSGDSRVTLEDRIRICLAEGLEFIVATDHNRATDYGPAIEALGAGARIAACVGDEITTRDPRMGHFNVFPILRAINAGGMTPAILLERIAEQVQRDERILQINHPRDGDIGYFNLFRYRAGTGSSDHPDFSLEFDAVEVYNGASGPVTVRAAMNDWISILNHDMRITATGNSDSHHAVLEDAGWPRNYVILEHDGLPTTEEVVAAVRGHRVIVSGGPLVEILDAEGRNVVGLDVPAGALRVRVQAPPWIEVARIRIVGPEGEIHAWDVSGTDTVRLDREFETDAAWVVAMAEGPRFNADVVTQDTVQPWSFTNPVWLRER